MQEEKAKKNDKLGNITNLLLKDKNSGTSTLNLNLFLQ